MPAILSKHTIARLADGGASHRVCRGAIGRIGRGVTSGRCTCLTEGGMQMHNVQQCGHNVQQCGVLPRPSLEADEGNYQ